jgi:hypothetical protein
MRVLVGAIDADLHDIRSGTQWQPAHDPDDHSASQALAKSLRSGSNGIAYNSVRYRGGENFAAFWPDVVKIPIQGPHLQYDWDGSKIASYYDYYLEKWFDL